MDLLKAIILRDSEETIDTETVFKLYAGPGAGKTRFLINHIKNVIANSNRLTKVKKIACITYTNTGVDTINKRLDNAINEVEVSTIHSFLYKHVIKPYLWTIKDEYNIPLAKVDGHEEIIPTFSIIKEWKEITEQPYLTDIEALKEELLKLIWTMKDGEIKLKVRPGNKLMIKNDSLIEYKKLCWNRALISHDDVLYLSYTILSKNDRILEILRAKFPYIFIDEFQDTNPIQSEILKMLGNKETVIGVIGDFGQSIYLFQGADGEGFIGFSLDGIKTYKIENNYRSSEMIINILNHVRNESGFIQNSPEKKSGIKPKIIVGNALNAYNKSFEISRDEKLCTLSFKNDVSNAMKFKIENFSDSTDINEPTFKETNDRGWMITYTIISIEYARENKITDAIKYMRKAYRKIENFEEKDVLINLQRLINEYDNYKDGSVKNFYNNYIRGHYGVGLKISGGKIKEYYEELKYKNIALTVSVSDDNFYKTIHKSKGDQFKSVLVILPPEKGKFNEEKQLEFILKPDINKEKNRLYYVALSRAMENLFINVPKLSKENIEIMEDIGFDVVKL